MSKTITLTDEERQDITVALSMRTCYIETGTVYLRAEDVYNETAKAVPLLPYQVQTLLRMNKILRKLYS